MNKEELLIEVKKLLEGRKAVKQDIKEKLYNLGFYLVDLGTRQQNEIHSMEIKIDFAGYDIAVGLASQSVGGNFRRKYYAVVIKL